MKKATAIILVFIMLITFASCRSTGDDTSSIVSSVEIVTSEPSDTEKTEVKEDVTSQTITETTFTSTIAKPDEVIFYKNGKYGSSKNENKIYKIAKLVESWYKSYESDTLPFCNWEYNSETIDEIKQKETVIEICYEDYTQIKMLNKIDHGKQRKIMIPLTGRYAYGVFLGKREYDYTILLGELGDGGLEKYFDGIILDKDVRKWESTVITPVKVTFYKGGKKSVSTESDLNRKIAMCVESWFKYATQCVSFNAITTDAEIMQQKYNATAIELEFDSSFSFYGGFIPKDERKIFITIDGEHPYTVFTGDGTYNTNWGNMSPVTGDYNRNLEQFFEGRKFEETIGLVGNVFNTENIVRIAFKGYYGKGTSVEVPAKDMTQAIKWLKTFVYGEKISTISEPGTNTHHIEIEYEDGTVIEEGLDVISVDGVNYKLNYGSKPEFYWDLISESKLPVE